MSGALHRPSRLRGDDEDDMPFSGKPMRTKGVEADPSAVCAPSVDPFMLTGRGRVFALGNGDARPPVDRAGSRGDQAHPSRRGDRLFFPDGRITDLNGNCVTAPEVPRASLPDCLDAENRIRRVREARYSPAGR